jgi:CYTH domain-containing protein
VPERRFLIAPSLARLIRKERGVVDRIVEGYFPARADRDHFVSIEPGHSFLVLAASERDGATRDEERTEVPRSQAEALLAVCAGKVGYECTRVRLAADREAMLDRFIAPGVLDLIRVEFERKEQADAFTPPGWFGPEVTRDAAYERGSLARAGIPHREDIPLSNAALEELLDNLENGFGAFQFGALSFGRSDPARGASPEDARMDSVAAGLAEALDMGGSSQQPTDDEPNVIVPLDRAESRGRR